MKQDISFRSALAWVYARDPDFLVELLSCTGETVEAAFARYSKRQTHASSPALTDVNTAWQELRQKAVDGTIDLVGTPFQKGPHIEAVGVFNAPHDMELPVYKNRPPLTIRPNTVAALVLVQQGDDYWLRPNDWYAEGGWWWRDIEVEWTQLLMAFPKEVVIDTPPSKLECDLSLHVPEPERDSSEQMTQDDTKLIETSVSTNKPAIEPPAPAPAKKIPRLTPTENLVIQAIAELFPSGSPRSLYRNEKIQGWFNDRKYSAPSAATIGRAIKKTRTD